MGIKLKDHGALAIFCSESEVFCLLILLGSFQTQEFLDNAFAGAVLG